MPGVREHVISGVSRSDRDIQQDPFVKDTAKTIGSSESGDVAPHTAWRQALAEGNSEDL